MARRQSAIQTFACPLGRLERQPPLSILTLDVTLREPAILHGTIPVRALMLWSPQPAPIRLNLDHPVFLKTFVFTSDLYAAITRGGTAGTLAARLTEYLVVRNAYLHYGARDDQTAATLLKRWVERGEALAAAGVDGASYVYGVDPALTAELRRVASLDPGTPSWDTMLRHGPSLTSRPLPNKFVAAADRVRLADWSLYALISQARFRAGGRQSAACALVGQFASQWRSYTALERGLVTEIWRLDPNWLTRDVTAAGLAGCDEASPAIALAPEPRPSMP
ncbi:hypothetical protein ACE7GA_20670 [Roseomonas sp. CCTCC AB2023176]|uniref:hypothetical protein n=1 Tax=Roseomonas sp. CCTCC AB2023176 TaxID=3342640 RepID=UPI0035E013F6